MKRKSVDNDVRQDGSRFSGVSLFFVKVFTTICSAETSSSFGCVDCEFDAIQGTRKSTRRRRRSRWSAVLLGLATRVRNKTRQTEECLS